MDVFSSYQNLSNGDHISKAFGSQTNKNRSTDFQFQSGFGLSTREALKRLHDDMKVEIMKTKNEFSKRKFFSWLGISISFKSELSKMRWPSVMFMIAQAIAHFIIAYILEVDHIATNWVGFQGIILSLLLSFNLIVNLWDTKLRYKELLMKSEQILKIIKRSYDDKLLLRQWKLYNLSSSRAKTLFIPKSPCVHQTLTYRDESCLNLPDYLLVKGDIIHLFPGEKAPGDCVSLKSIIEPNCSEQVEEKIYLREGQIFCDRLKISGHDDDHIITEIQESRGDGVMQGKNYMLHFDHAKLKRSNKGTDFLMLSTPYIKCLKISLQRSHKRPVNSVEKECFIITRKYFETFVIPLVFIMSTVVTAIHYGYLDMADKDQKIKTISIAHLLLRPSLTVMPFLPWMFPCLWLVVNAYGSARILCCGETLKKSTDKDTIRSYDPYSTPVYSHKFDNLLATPTAAGSSENKQDEAELQHLQSNINMKDILKVCLDLIKGKSGHVWRSSSLLQVLGSLTSLCCIDKVGILSWPNPTPEKIFVLTKEDNNLSSKFTTRHETNSEDPSYQLNTINNDNNQQQNIMTINSDIFESNLETQVISNNIQDDQISNYHASIHSKQPITNNSRSEILDISQISSCFRDTDFNLSSLRYQSPLQFDDLNWRKYISNLKPLGLSIMMNNCCESSFGDYFRFYKHISYESILRCNLTPVVKRRCLCSISKLIGFSDNAVDSYKYSGHIGIYKLIDISSIKKGKLVSSLENTTRLKLPFPNMTCNIHQDTETGGYQVFSQGTADIIMDACVEYWDGRELMPLDESSRKKIMDFYHRSSLTSYCSAFSYTPLLKAHNLVNHYVELPPENSKFAPQLRKLANEDQEEFLQNQVINIPNKSNSRFNIERNISDDEGVMKRSSVYPKDTRIHQEYCHQALKTTRRHLSVEDLGNDTKEKTDRLANEKKKISKNSKKLNETLDELTDQVFVGMVALQYQACGDFVALVEQLEHACIRFVHFSKENELRSRVFSEKMGLESGWNCHISLQSNEALEGAYRNTLKPLEVHANENFRELHCSSELIFNSPSTRILNLLKGRWNHQRASGDNNSEDDATSCAMSVSSDERTLNSWKSLPSIVMKLTAKIASESQNQASISTPDHQFTNSSRLRPSHICDDSSTDNLPEREQDYPVNSENVNSKTDNGGPPNEECFESLAFDMSNRAKLPKGIENIRPHLQTVDNVPLQVSLFTDCNPELTQDMIKIMQEYGEVVCVIGSSASRLNTQIFLQANASISLEPLLPQCCTRVDDTYEKQSVKRKKKWDAKKGSKKNKIRPKSENDSDPAGNNNQTTRLNNPRDRLGIGAPTELKVIRPQEKSSSYLSSNTSSQSNSTTATSSTTSSSDPSSESSDNSYSEDDMGDESIDRFLDDDKLLDDQQEHDFNDLFSDELPSPNFLASKLASLPCSYSYNRKDPVDLYRLIMEARHFTFKMKNTFVCMICFALSISSAQFLTSLVFLPPMLSSGLTIWLTVVVVPLMSFSLMSTTMDSQVMKIAVGKNLQLKPGNIKFFVVCYLVKFIPSIIVVVVSFGLIIAHSCKLTGFGSSSFGPCWMFTNVQHNNSTSPNEDLLWSTHLLTAQVCAAFLLVFYFVVISAGFVHRSHLMWQRSPTRNSVWVAISLSLLFAQLFYNQLVLYVNLGSSKVAYEFLSSLPLHIWLISFLCSVIVVSINLLVKRAEIKAIIRQQRRARFDFNTKLGMNSPF